MYLRTESHDRLTQLNYVFKVMITFIQGRIKCIKATVKLFDIKIYISNKMLVFWTLYSSILKQTVS